MEGDKHSPYRNVTHGKHHFHWGEDVMCKQVEKEAKEILPIGGSMIDVNCHLCWQSDVGKAIKKKQKDYVHHSTLDSHHKYNFLKSCELKVGKKETCKLGKRSLRVWLETRLFRL